MKEGPESRQSQEQLEQDRFLAAPDPWPWDKGILGKSAAAVHVQAFRLAHCLRESQVEAFRVNVYDLHPGLFADPGTLAPRSSSSSTRAKEGRPAATAAGAGGGMGMPDEEDFDGRFDVVRAWDQLRKSGCAI